MYSTHWIWSHAWKRTQLKKYIEKYAVSWILTELFWGMWSGLGLFLNWERSLSSLRLSFHIIYFIMWKQVSQICEWGLVRIDEPWQTGALMAVGCCSVVEVKLNYLEIQHSLSTERLFRTSSVCLSSFAIVHLNQAYFRTTKKIEIQNFHLQGFWEKKKGFFTHEGAFWFPKYRGSLWHNFSFSRQLWG